MGSERSVLDIFHPFAESCVYALILAEMRFSPVGNLPISRGVGCCVHRPPIPGESAR
jgi:hypothetical protein